MSGSLVVVVYEMCAPPVQGVSLIDPNIPLITRSTLKHENTPFSLCVWVVVNRGPLTR